MTLFAVAKKAIVDSINVRFQGIAHDGFAASAHSTMKRHAGFGCYGICWGTKLDAPEIDVRIEKSDAVRVDAILRADLADDANLHLPLAFLPNDDQLLLDRKLMP